MDTMIYIPTVEGNRVCSKCKLIKHPHEFARNKSKRCGFDSWCKLCHASKWHERCLSNPDLKLQGRKWQIKNPERYLYLQAKHRSTKEGVFFALNVKDIIIPVSCPVLGMLLKFEGGVDNSPSIDRLIPNLGYTKENIRVISMRANRIKNDSTLNELKLVADYVERELFKNEENIRGWVE